MLPGLDAGAGVDENMAGDKMRYQAMMSGKSNDGVSEEAYLDRWYRQGGDCMVKRSCERGKEQEGKDRRNRRFDSRRTP